MRDTQNLRRLEQEIRQVVKEMKEAISDKDFERAVYLREREIELREDLERMSVAGADEDGVLEVTPRDIEEVISSWTGIPVVAPRRATRPSACCAWRTRCAATWSARTRAISAIARAIRRSRLGVANPQRPMGSFIFLGPSGVGKTEVARRLAEFLFGSQQALVRFDMSEYMEKHAVSKMIGSPPGYVGHEEGGQLTERIRRQPYSLILFDEIEKAHPDVANLLLQILEDGMLTDAYGNQVDFRNTLVLMTSNIGSKLVLRGGRMGFGEAERAGRASSGIEEEILGELKRTFSPEFINRVDEVIVFNPLGEDELRTIVDILLDDVNDDAGRARPARRGLGGRQGVAARRSAGVEPSTGARPLRRTIQRHVQDAVSEILIRQQGESIEAHRGRRRGRRAARSALRRRSLGEPGTTEATGRRAAAALAAVVRRARRRSVTPAVAAARGARSLALPSRWHRSPDAGDDGAGAASGVALRPAGAALAGRPMRVHRVPRACRRCPRRRSASTSGCELGQPLDDDAAESQPPRALGSRGLIDDIEVDALGGRRGRAR